MRKATNAIGCLFILSAAAAQAMPLVQTDPNGLAFHSRATTAAVDFYEILNSGTDINGVIYAPPNPGLNGSLMWIAGVNVGQNLDNDTDLTDGLHSYAEYTVNFSSQGTYRVYVAGQRTGGATQLVGEGGSTTQNDSIWVGAVNRDHTHNVATDWTQLAFLAGGISYRMTNALWVIDGTNENMDLTLTIGLREDGVIYDRVAFVLEGSGVSPDDITVIPEPSSLALALAAFGIVGTCCLRRRR